MVTGIEYLTIQCSRNKRRRIWRLDLEATEGKEKETGRKEWESDEKQP